MKIVSEKTGEETPIFWESQGTLELTNCSWLSNHEKLQQKQRKTKVVDRFKKKKTLLVQEA